MNLFYDEYLERLADRDDTDTNDEIHNISDILNYFNLLDEDEQDYFMFIANQLIKQRNPEYDVYTDIEVKQKLGDVDLDKRLKSLEDMVKQLVSNKQSDIETKSVLSVDELEKRYNISKTQQKALRARFRNPLPYRQLVANGKITYVVKDVEQWLANNSL